MTLTLNQQNLDEFFQAVSEAINGAILGQGQIDMNRFCQTLVGKAGQTAESLLPPQASPECGVVYDAQHFEYLVLAMSLLTTAWTAEIFRLKTIDDHCYTHKSANGQPCPIGSQFHASLREDFLSMLTQMGELAKQRLPSG